MSIDKEKKSNRLLASRRYTHDSFTDSQESFTEVLDLGASEIYTQAHKIPSSELPYSGSSQIGSYYTDGEDNILRYWWRHKLTKSNLNNEVWFFLNPTGSSSGIGAQLIDSNQQTSFISPKYSVSSLANATTEDSTPGYLAKVFVSTAAVSGSVSDSDVVSVNNYTFDYKTGVVQFTDGTVDPSDSQYVYMSVYQYVGKTLEDGVEITGDISGSASSTGSFGHLVVAGNITASGVVRADAFESVTGGETIDFKDSVSVTGNVNADNLTADSSSFSTRVTNLKSDSGSFSTRVTNLKTDSGSFSTRITNLKSDSGSFSTRVTNLKADSGSFSTRTTTLEAASSSFSTRVTTAEIELENTIISASAQISSRISGSFVAPSASISTRLTTEEANVDALQSDSGSFSTRVTNLKTDSGSFSTRITADSSSFSTRVTDLKTDSGSFSTRITADSSSFSTRVTNLKADSGSFSTRITADSSSFSTRVTNLKSDSGSFSTRVTNLKTDSGSFSDRATESTASIFALKQDSASLSSRIDTESGSFALRITQATASIDQITQSIVELKQDSASFSNRATESTASIFALKQDSASLSTRINTESSSFALRITRATASIAEITQSIVELKEDSGSFALRMTQATASIREITQSIVELKSDSGSFSLRTTTLEGTGTIQGLGTTNNVLFSSITASDDVRFDGDLVVDGKVTAQEFHTEIVSSSIIFTSGSTKFGDSIDDNHSFTGSIEQSGSFNLNDGDLTIKDNLEVNGNISGSVTSTGSFGRVEVAGDSSFTGNVTIGGNIQIGDADSDSLNIAADLTSNLIPNIDSTFDIGSNSKNWRRGYIEKLEVTNITASGDISGSKFSSGSLGHFYVDNKLGIGIKSPKTSLHIDSTNGIIIPVGNDSQRSSDATVGEIRFNTDQQSYEGYDGNNWGTLGGMTDVDQDTKITAETSAGADNDELKFFTAGTERLRILADGHISASGDITASKNVRIDGDLIVTGLSNSNISQFSSSLSENITRVTASIREITQSVFELKQDSASLSTRLDTESGSFALRITRATASIFEITQSIVKLKENSGSFSDRATESTASIFALKQDSASLSTRIDTESGSFALRLTQATASIDAITSSIDALKVDSGSFSTRITTDSSSFSTRITADSSSFSTRVTTEEINVDKLQTTASALIDNFDQVQSLGKTDNVLFSSITASDDVKFQGDLVVDGTVTAQEFHTEIVSSSIIFTSGSTKFGDSIDDLHRFTGSLFISGNLTAVNLVVDSGSVSERLTAITQSISALKTDSGSISIRLSDVEAGSTSKTLISGSAQIASDISGSFVEVSSSISIRLSDVEAGSTSKTLISGSAQIASNISGSFTSTSESISIRLSDVEAGSTSKTLVSGSAQISDDISGSFTAPSASFSTRITNLVSDSASFSNRITIAENELENTIFSASAQLAEEISGSFTAPSASFSTRITNLKTDSGSISIRLSDVEAGSTSKTLVSGSAQIASDISGSFVQPSSSFSTRITNLKTDSGSFSLRNTNLETTSSALINNFDQVQSLGKTDGVVFSNITASNDISASGNLFISNNIDIDGTGNLAGNVLMQSELNVLGNITASGNISSSITSVASFGLIKEQGLNLNERFSRNTHEAFELDENGDFTPTSTTGYIIDPKWELDENGDLQRRERELWTFNWDDYFSD